MSAMLLTIAYIFKMILTWVFHIAKSLNVPPELSQQKIIFINQVLLPIHMSDVIKMNQNQNDQRCLLLNLKIQCDPAKF